jgi:hypothetical protein
MKLLAILAAAAASLCAATAAAGTTSGNASFGPVTFTLTDLDPNDGIAPSITLLPLSGSAASQSEIDLDYFDGGGQQDAQLLASDGTPLTLNRTTPTGSLEASVTGLADPATWNLTADAKVDTTGDQYITASAGAFSPMQDFVLSPNTELSISASSHMSGTIPVDGESNQLIGNAYILLNVPDALGPHYTFSAPASMVLMSAMTAPTYDYATPLVLTYDNNSAQSVSASFQLYTSIDAKHVAGALPVPEPAELDMVAAGLPLLLVLRRRARRRMEHGRRA